jgi:multidrug efflux pump subunit AcrA (membrane-fusion protein)
MRSPLLLAAAATVLASAAHANEYECLIEARQTVEIRSPVDGLLAEVRVQRGEVVRKGQVVVMLESGPEQAALAIARSRAAMTGPVEAAQARVEFARTKEKR